MTWTVLERREKREHGDLILTLLVERNGQRREVTVSGTFWLEAEIGKPVVLEREPDPLVSLAVECVYTRQILTSDGRARTSYFLQTAPFAGIATPTSTISRELYEVMVSRGVKVVR